MISPHGNELVNRFAKKEEVEKLEKLAQNLRKITIN